MGRSTMKNGVLLGQGHVWGTLWRFFSSHSTFLEPPVQPRPAPPHIWIYEDLYYGLYLRWLCLYYGSGSEWWFLAMSPIIFFQVRITFLFVDFFSQEILKDKSNVCRLNMSDSDPVFPENRIQFFRRSGSWSGKPCNQPDPRLCLAHIYCMSKKSWPIFNSKLIKKWIKTSWANSAHIL